MKSRYLLMSLFFSFSAWADQVLLDQLAGGNINIVKCPVVSDDYSKMTTKLDILKTSIKSSANCKDISDRMAQFGPSTPDRDRFLGLIEKAKTTPLTDFELKDISKYVESITQNVGSLVDLISNSATCFEADGAQKALTLLSGFISEASGLAAQVGGPWGTPIAFGGQVIAGFISGLDKVMKDRVGYDFRDRNQWSSYVQNLCTYQSFRGEIDTLLHPKERLTTLLEIKRKLDANLLTIQSQCSDCRSLMNVSISDAKTDVHVQDIDAKYNVRLGLLSVRVNLAKQWVVSEIARVQAQANADWNNAPGKTLLSQAARDMESFLLDLEAPKFVDFQTAQTGSAFNELNQYLLSEGTLVIRQAMAAKPPLMKSDSLSGVYPGMWSSPNYAPIYKLIAGSDWRAIYKSENRADDELEFRLQNVSKQAREKLDSTNWAFGTAIVFCDFFRQTDLYSYAVERSCSSKQFVANAKSLTEMNNAALPQFGTQPNMIQSTTWTDAINTWANQVQASLASVEPRR